MNVLFIDDEQMLCTLGERILKKAGYDVITAESGQEGIDAFKADTDSFDLVIIDQSMHGLTGIETIVDLYSGIGTIAIYLANSAKEVIGIEILENAVTDARKNSQLNGISNCSFIQGDIKE